MMKWSRSIGFSIAMHPVSLSLFWKKMAAGSSFQKSRISYISYAGSVHARAG